MVLQQHETSFQRAVARAELSTLNRSSPVNGLAPVHFAVLWPIGLEILIDRGVNVNAEDHYGRRPVHLAIALGLIQSVELLITADCGLFTPSTNGSLLQYALRLDVSQTHRIIDLVVEALIDRHSRLLDLARDLLPGSSFSKLNIGDEQKKERNAPLIIERLISHGINIPEALELDGKSFHDHSRAPKHGKLMTRVASAFWDAGFQDIDEPDEQGLTPMLQSWVYADFEMVTWFAEKGVSLSSRHRDAPLTGLHLYADHLEHFRAPKNDPGANSMRKECMTRIQEAIGIPHDDCTCPCSPKGCTPAKFLICGNLRYRSRKLLLREWIQIVEPTEPLQYVYDYTRCLLFQFLGGEHSCCSLYYNGGLKIRDERIVPEDIRDNRTKQQRLYDEHWQKVIDHAHYCVDGIPIPCRGATSSARDAKEIGTTLDALMSHYDEMARPDTMPLEEQPFHYINWVITERYLMVDVRFGCDHDCSVVQTYLGCQN